MQSFRHLPFYEKKSVLTLINLSAAGNLLPYLVIYTLFFSEMMADDRNFTPHNQPLCDTFKLTYIILTIIKLPIKCNTI